LPSATAAVVSPRRFPIAWLAGFLLLAALVVGALTIDFASWLPVRAGGDAPITALVVRSNLPIIISAGGELESAEGAQVLCEVEGSNVKIVEMTPEGTQVRQGQVIVRLDPSEVNNRLAQQEITVTQLEATAKAAVEELKIQKNLVASSIAAAELALKLAELDKEKYEEGDYIVEFNELKGSIALANTELQEAEDTREYYRTLVKKGFRTPEQLRAKEQAVERAKYNLSRDDEKLKVLETYTRKRQLAELTAKAEEAARELERTKSSSIAAVTKAETDMEVAEATARLERKQLERIQAQLQFCELPAPCDGTVVYSREGKNPLALGQVVHYKQKLFAVTKMSEMQVKAFVHEAEVKKVRPGMPVEVRVDALGDRTFQGTVQEVANFYDSTRQWLSGGVKEYETIIRIDNLPGTGLKPGMTAQANIIAGELTDGLLVPIPAIAEREGQYYCYVVANTGIQPRQVSIGDNTATFVEIKSGLAEGETVALDARHRAANELEAQPAAGTSEMNPVAVVP